MEDVNVNFSLINKYTSNGLLETLVTMMLVILYDCAVLISKYNMSYLTITHMLEILNQMQLLIIVTNYLFIWLNKNINMM